LLQNNFRILGVGSDNPRIRDWAQTEQIEWFDLDDNLSAIEHHFRTGQRPDYLFAITHLALLPDEILEIPTKFGINFHDGPLPRYAGLNAPAWALINGEVEYGISWHRLTKGVDRGDLLLQQSIDIAADETALSLNTKCFSAALDSFDLLLNQLWEETSQPLSQNMADRSYFSRSRKPDYLGVLDWNRPAKVLDGLIRALSFGQYPNPLASAKLFIDQSAWLVTSAIPREGNAAAGTIIGCDEGELEIACAEGSLAITGIATLTGDDVAIADVCQSQSLSEGNTLPLVSQDDDREVAALVAAVGRSEPRWLHRLEQLTPAILPFPAPVSTDADEAGFVTTPLQRPAESSDPTISSSSGAISAFLLTMLQMSEAEAVDVSLSISDDRLSNPYPGQHWASLFSAERLLGIGLISGEDTSQFMSRVGSELALASETTPWLKDLVARHPSLRENAYVTGGLSLPVGIALSDETTPLAQASHQALTLVVNGDDISLVTNSQKLSKTRAQRLAATITLVWDQMCNAPGKPLDQISLLSDAEQEMMRAWNATGAEFSASCVHTLFTDQVARTPDHEAVVFEDTTLTYRELDRKANSLAHTLASRGVGPDSLVGVYIERSLELMVATLGVLKAGAAYVPLDPAFPDDRIRYMIDDAELGIIVTQKTLLGRLSNCDAAIVVIDESTIDADPDHESPPDSGVRPEHLAYVIYTSGSTGKPKGVMVEHRNVANFFVGMDQRN